jgi:hypothetical protein
MGRAVSRQRLKDGGQRGAALLVALGYMMVLMLFAGVFIEGLNRANDNMRRRERGAECLRLAQSGIAMAAAELQLNRAYAGADSLRLGNGCFDVQVEAVAQDSVYTATAVGYLHPGRKDHHKRVLYARIAFEDSAGAPQVVISNSPLWGGVDDD